MADRRLLADGTSFRLLAGSSDKRLLTRGTLYYVTYPVAGSLPSKAQIKAGQDATGSAAAAAGSEPGIVAAGTQTFGVDGTGLSGGTQYTVAYLWSEGNPATDSNIATYTFTTSGGGGTTAPPLPPRRAGARPVFRHF